MGDDFHDAVATLCAKEMSAGIRENDAERCANVVSVLATMLGRSTARICNGDSDAIETMLTGAENLAATEAAGMADLMGFVQSVRARAAERGK